MYKIQTLNQISQIIHNRLDADHYLISAEEPVPDGILVRSADMHQTELPESLLAIARAGAGTNNIPIDECTRRGIAVFNTPGANANAVAELVICGLMLAGRNIIGGVDWARSLTGADVAKQVEKGKGRFAGPEVRGKTLGVIGLGAIGVIVANAAVQGLGMNVLGYDPFMSVENAWALTRRVTHTNSLNEVYQTADFITLHLPLNDGTRGMIDAGVLAQMKDGVHILNFSRAELVDQDALAAALESGKVASYVTDFPTEKVLAMKNTVAIPHLGASTPESEDNCAVMAAEEIADYLENGNITHSVNFPDVQMERTTPYRVCALHKNVQGMVSSLSAALADAGVNIETVASKSRKDYACTLLDVAAQPSSETLETIRAVPGMLRVRLIG
ncbi:MAG: 3-phosphoglycerate dehydrogenase family protein [Clostridia bacterium]|nr:3-phosphoglycerate dehydrogenase family protein [Clostridia bacterium]